MSRRVARRPRARQDIIEQAEFIGADNPRAAERFLGAIERAERMLAATPGMGAARDFPRLEGIRMWPVKGFTRHLIFYRPIEGGIEVIRMLHASRDIEALFRDEEGGTPG